MINKHHIHKFLSKVALITICLLSFGSNNSWAQCTFSATVQGSAGTTTRYYLTDPLGNVIDDTAPYTSPSEGNYRLYAVTHDASTTNFPTVGGNVSSITGNCFSIDFVPAICRCSSNSNNLNVSTTAYNTNYTQSYALMNGSTIAAVNTTGTFTAAQLTAAGLTATTSVRIYAINHDASATPTVGQALPNSDCYDADSFALIGAYSCCVANAGTWIE
jgi:hypothetical protein